MKKLLACFILLSSIATALAGGRSIININPAWKFHLGDPNAKFEAPGFNDSAWEDVALPHTLKEVSLDLDKCKDDNRQLTFHRLVGYYRKTLMLPNKDPNRNYFLEFQGAMQTLELWVNGKHIGKYEVSGYDSFHYDVTDVLKAGKNVIAIKVDNRVNDVTPPDGKSKSKDFILFGGLYRDVFLVITGKIYVNFPWEAHDAGVRITFPKVSESASSVQIATTIKNSLRQTKSVLVETQIKDATGNVVATLKKKTSVAGGKTATVTQDFKNLKLKLWSPDSPVLYTATSTVVADGKVTDLVNTRFGVRSIKFTKDQGFFLNGKHVKLEGSNRHQTLPFIGNAVPNSLHRRDVEIIKNCGMNWIRASHYPHDPDFLDACDELGVMVLEEGPTWMRGSNEAWMNNLYKAFTSMIRRDRNHPSIIVWNACINHSGLEKRLGEICKEEDYRPTGAEMPRTPMDFRHGTVSGDGALTIEYTGHTYPRGRGLLQVDENGGVDGEWQVAKRHWEHVNASYLKKDNAGMAVWCMFDYNTFHNENEQGMVWHGVCDLTRIPKHSYFWYTAELTKKPMAYIINYRKGKVCIFSNCDEIELFENTGSGFKSLGKKKPMEGFVLNSPPFDFDVSPNILALKAVGFNKGKKVTETDWLRPGLPKAIRLKADSKTIIADGSDLTRIVATVVDAKGTPVKSLASEIYFNVQGKGTIVGDNPAQIRGGKAVVYVRSHYTLGDLTITAGSPELKSAQTSVTCVKAANNVLFPKTLPEFKPTPPTPFKKFAWLIDLYPHFFQSRNRWPECSESKTIHGKTYTHVLKSKTPAQIVYSLGGIYKTFSAKLLPSDGNTSYKIFLDGKEVLSKKNLKQEATINLSVEGIQSMRLLTTRAINSDNPDAIWVDAKLTYGRSSKVDSLPYFDDTQIKDLATIQPKDPAPKPVKFKRVNHAKKGTWVESNVVMIEGTAKKYPISVKGCEYRIYSEPWTNKKGWVKPGDAVTLRVKTSRSKWKGKIKIGGYSTTFEVRTK